MTSDWPPKVLFFFDWLVYLMRGTKQMIKPTVSTKADHTDSFRLLKCMYWSHFVKRKRAFLCFFFLSSMIVLHVLKVPHVLLTILVSMVFASPSYFASLSLNFLLCSFEHMLLTIMYS